MKLIKADIYALLDALISCGGQLYDSIVYIQINLLQSRPSAVGHHIFFIS